MTAAPAVTTSRGLRVVAVDDWGRWDRFVGSTPGSTHCHLAGWHDVMSNALGHECSYLAAVDDSGEWRGILPLVRVRGLLGHFLVSLPFLNDGGPLGTEDACARLVA